MNVEKFELEWWLNPLDAVAPFNMGSSYCRPMNMQDLFEKTGALVRTFVCAFGGA